MKLTSKEEKKQFKAFRQRVSLGAVSRFLSFLKSPSQSSRVSRI